MRPGVSWPEMHRLANRKILEGLKAGKFVQGDVEEMMAAHLGALFMPHGLGHFLGLDTHDVGGYGPIHPPRIMEPGLKSLRTARSSRSAALASPLPPPFAAASLRRQGSSRLGCFPPRPVRVLEEGMVITVEPGCYFNPFLLEPAMDNEAVKGFLVADRIRACMGFGGVRIEVRRVAPSCLLLDPAVTASPCTCPLCPPHQG